MDELLLHPQSRLHLKALLTDPPHALLLLGPSGIGKGAVAQAWGRQLSPLVEVVAPDERGTIAIETVRALYRRTRSRQTDRQVVVIDHAEAMGNEAQNAFLKLLEEPRAGVTFVLTAATPDALLPTITSRLQTLQLLPVPRGDLQNWITQQISLGPQQLAQLLFVAAGRPAITAQLLANTQTFDHYRELMHLAKRIVAGSAYDRLALLPELTKNRTDMVATLEAAAHMLVIHIRLKPEPQLLRFAEGLQTCLARLAQNGNPRAQLTALFMLY